MFWYIFWREGSWQIHCTLTCTFDAISPCNPLEQLVNSMQKLFLLIAELLILCFAQLQSWAALYPRIHYSVGGHTATTLCARLPRALCISRYNYLCQFSSTFFFIHVLSTRRLPIHAKIWALFFGIRGQTSHPVFLVVYENCQKDLKYILPCIATWSYHIKQVTFSRVSVRWIFELFQRFIAGHHADSCQILTIVFFFSTIFTFFSTPLQP